MKGKFITIEGIEGAGKSTQLAFIQKYLADQDQTLTVTREPGGTELGEQIRKLLLTQIPLLRMVGIKENLFINYLGTNYSGNYTELGYGIDGIARLFRIEGILSFQNGKFIDSGIRIGISSILDFD